MKTDYQKYLIFLSVFLLLTLTLSCSGRSGKIKETIVQPSQIMNEDPPEKLIKIISPEEDTGFKLNQPVKLTLALEDNKTIPDSVTVFFNGNHVATIKYDPWNYSIPPVFTVTTGRKSLKVTAYKGGKPKNTITRFVVIYSDIVPKKYGYKVIHTYPHDRAAFTQGLFYDKGELFEGTGQESGSTLREVELETGKVLRQHDLDESLFGEGIALYRDRIFQAACWTGSQAVRQSAAVSGTRPFATMAASRAGVTQLAECLLPKPTVPYGSRTLTSGEGLPMVGIARGGEAARLGSNWQRLRSGPRGA